MPTVCFIVIVEHATKDSRWSFVYSWAQQETENAKYGSKILIYGLEDSPNRLYETTFISNTIAETSNKNEISLQFIQPSKFLTKA